MDEKPQVDRSGIEELGQQFYRQRRALRRRRLRRLKESGRVVDVAGFPPPNPSPPPLYRLHETKLYEAQKNESEEQPDAEEKRKRRPTVQWRWVFSKLFLLVEIAAVIGLVTILFNLWRTSAELNQELAQIQRAEGQSLALPTPSATPLIDVVILPGGHKPPVDGLPPEPGEAGDIPAHLLPALNAYVPPPIPTPSAEQARRIQIAEISVDSPVVQGMYDWEQLKKGVAQHIGSATPGQTGNMVLAGHNDIYGEVFRDLDKLSPGDEIVVSTNRQSYTYVVRDTKIVEPTEVSVLAPTEYAGATLISCYPYRVNTKRIIVFADLVENA